MKNHATRAAPLLALAFAPFAAHAEEAASDTTIIVTAPQLTDAAEAQVAKTPGGADVVGHEDYADKSIMSLRDTLAFSPGVYLQPRYGQEVRISIRGSGLSRGFHMRGLTLPQDGVPINLADDNGDFQELEPIFFDHLEVYRGANALRFGSGTLGGAVNGVTPTGGTAEGFYCAATSAASTAIAGSSRRASRATASTPGARSAPTRRTATAIMSAGGACAFTAMSGCSSAMSCRAGSMSVSTTSIRKSRAR